MADETDFQILVRLWRDPFASYEAIGHGLELSGNTAKNRIERLREDGLIGGIWVLPSPAVFRRTSRIFAFRPPSRPEKAIEAALRVDPVVWALERLDHVVSVNAYLDAATRGPPRELVDLLGPPVFAISPRFFDAADEPTVLSPLDLRVLRALIRQPRASLQDLGKRCRLTPKTVRAHRDAMFRDGTFGMLTPLQGARSPGLVVYNLFVGIGEVNPAVRQRVLSALPRCVLLAETKDPTGLYLAGRTPSLAEALADEAKAGGIPGVARVQLNLFLRHEFAAERIEGWIDDQLAMWDRARRPR
ncbi:MAG TPA: winged helix-turn-helix transcriptional regulator [Thermoplasmata archaeon]|nr:winged helix-turn-helix transcriptional regulator [Thermoplasmata archaeon]